MPKVSIKNPEYFYRILKENTQIDFFLKNNSETIWDNNSNNYTECFESDKLIFKYRSYLEFEIDISEEVELACSNLTRKGILVSMNERNIIFIVEPTIERVDFLREFNDLKFLVLRNCKSLTDISAISTLTHLTSLELTYCVSLTDLTPLSTLKNLNKLNIIDFESLTDLTLLSTLTHLTSLNLSLCESITDLTPLSNLTNLTSLDLSECKTLTNIESLANLTNLISLNLNSCRSLTNIKGLTNLTLLTSLDLSDCELLTDLTPLSNLSLLTSLDLSGCTSLSDIIPLSNLIQLESLKLSQIGTKNINSLSNLNKLIFLDISNIIDLLCIKPIKNLENLTKLWIIGTPALDLNELADLPKIREINSFNNEAFFVLLKSAFRRNDLEFIYENFIDWTKRAYRSTNPSSFFGTLVEAGLLMVTNESHNDQYKLYPLFTELSQNLLAKAQNPVKEGEYEIEPVVWLCWADLAMFFSKKELLEALQNLVVRNARMEARGMLVPVFTALADIQLKNPIALTEVRNWVEEKLTLYNTPDLQKEIAAGVAVFYAGIGVDDLVKHWLEIGGSINTRWKSVICKALGTYYLQKNNTSKTKYYFGLIQSDDLKDQSFQLLAEYWINSFPEEAIQALESIQDEVVRLSSAGKIAYHEHIISKPAFILQMILIIQEDVEQYAEFMAHLIQKEAAAQLLPFLEKTFGSPETSEGIKWENLLSMEAFQKNIAANDLAEYQTQISTSEKEVLINHLLDDLINKEIITAKKKKIIEEALSEKK